MPAPRSVCGFAATSRDLALPHSQARRFCSSASQRALSRRPTRSIAAALDRERVAFLTANGVRAATSRAVVWVPPDTLSHDEAQALARTLAGGVEAIDEFLHAPRPWQRPPGAVEYFFHPAMFISHANAVEGRVFISFPRIADGTAAFLHETTHALLFPSPSFLATYEGEEEEVPWLVEGLPTYVAKAVAERTGFRGRQSVSDRLDRRARLRLARAPRRRRWAPRSRRSSARSERRLA